MPSAGSEEKFERGFQAYLRGEHLQALLLWEEAFLSDPTHEQALWNCSRLLPMLGAPDGGAVRIRSLMERANASSSAEPANGDTARAS